MPKKKVVLQVDVPEDFRTRLRIQALKRGITMGDLLLQIVEEPLRKLESEDEG